MGPATHLAKTHRPSSAEAPGLYSDSEAGVWSRQGSNHVHREEHCTAGVVTGTRRPRLVPASLAITWKRLPCRQCLPQGIMAALRAGKLPPMPACGVRAATPTEIRAAVKGRLQRGQPCPPCKATGKTKNTYTGTVQDCPDCDATGYQVPALEAI